MYIFTHVELMCFFISEIKISKVRLQFTYVGLDSHNRYVDGGIIIVRRYGSSSVIGGVTVLDIGKWSITEIRNTNWCNNQPDNAHQPACNFIVT